MVIALVCLSSAQLQNLWLAHQPECTRRKHETSCRIIPSNVHARVCASNHGLILQQTSLGKRGRGSWQHKICRHRPPDSARDKGGPAHPQALASRCWRIRKVHDI